MELSRRIALCQWQHRLPGTKSKDVFDKNGQVHFSKGRWVDEIHVNRASYDFDELG